MAEYRGEQLPEPPPPDSLLRHLVAHTAEVIEALPAASIESVERILAGEPPLFVRNPEVLPLWKQRWGDVARGDLICARLRKTLRNY